MSRPNILFVITDQQRADHLGCAGHPVLRTPHLDALASDGMRLDRHYTNHPLCTPSRAALITGRYPHSNRVYDNGCCLAPGERTLPEVLGGAGYETHAIGKLHLSSWREPKGVSFESESFWASGRAPSEPVPYAGFDEVEICTRHINPRTGHYGVWMRKNHPDVLSRWEEFLTPHASGAGGTFDWTMPPEAHANTWIADRAIDYLESHRESEQPFFLHIGFPDPHHPFRAPDPWGALYDPAMIPLPDTYPSKGFTDRPPEYEAYYRGVLNHENLGAGDFNTEDLGELSPPQLQAIHAKTYGMISFVDNQVGRILAALEATGQAENTLVIFTSDHGDYMGDHGLILKGPLLLEGLLRVPMLMRGPGIARAGGTTKALTSHIDLMPTLLDLAGASPPPGLEGRSFRSVLENDEDQFRDRVMVECLHQFQFDRNVKALITDRWKLVYWGGQTYGELYDLETDPQECCNLWDSAEHRPIRQEMLLKLLDELVCAENTLPLPLAPT